MENGFNAVDAKSPKEESLAQLVIRRRDTEGEVVLTMAAVAAAGEVSSTMTAATVLYP